MHFPPTEKYAFLQKNACSCIKTHFPAERCGFRGAHHRKPQETSGRFKRSRMKNAGQLSRFLSASVPCLWPVHCIFHADLRPLFTACAAMPFFSDFPGLGSVGGSLRPTPLGGANLNRTHHHITKSASRMKRFINPIFRLNSEVFPWKR